MIDITAQVKSLSKAHNEKIEALILNSDLSNYDKLKLLQNSSNFTISQWYSDIYYKYNNLFSTLLENKAKGRLMLWTHLYEMIEDEVNENNTVYCDAVMSYSDEKTFTLAKTQFLNKLFNEIVQRKELGFIINW